MRPTWTWSGRLVTVLLGLAPGGVYLGRVVSPRRRCALTAPFHPCRRSRSRATAPLRRCRFCGTFPRVSPGRRYRPPCPSVSGLSSKAHLLDLFRPADDTSAAARSARVILAVPLAGLRCSG